MRRADGGQLALLAVAPVGAPSLLGHELAVDERRAGGPRRPRSCGTSSPRARSATSSAARVEAKSTSCLPRPIQSGRPMPRARWSTSGSRSSTQAAAIAPTSCSTVVAVGAVLVDEREDRLGVDRHLRLRAREAVPGEQLVVVDDDPVVHARHVAVTDRMVVGGDRGVALRVVAHVHEHLRRVRGDDDRLEERAGAGLLLVHLERGTRRGARSRRHRRPARRSRPAAPARRTSGSCSSRTRSCIPRCRTSAVRLQRDDASAKP